MPSVDAIIKSGYCPISNKYRILARLDRPDWKEYMAEKRVRGWPGNADKNHEQAMKWVNGLGHGAADFYRRMYSRDKLTVSGDIFQQVRKANSSHGWGRFFNFVPLVEAHIIEGSPPPTE
jgi:hypothetical protein